MIINNTRNGINSTQSVVYFRFMSIKIGEKVKEVLEDNGMKTSAFAQKINKSRETVYQIFERESIDTELLLTIGKVLNYNFFEFLALESGLPLISQIVLKDSVEPNVFKEKYYQLLEEHNQLHKNYLLLLNEKSIT